MNANRSTERSSQLYRAAQDVMPGGVSSPVRAFRSVGGVPRFIARGEGAELIDVDGHRYIDYVLSWGALAAGHAHPAVVDAVGEQLRRGTSYGAPSELETLLAERVRQVMPSIELLRFVSSGTEATMSALRLARAFTGRSHVIKFAGCYHGHADAFLVQAGSGVATLGLPDSPGTTAAATSQTLSAPYNDVDAVATLCASHDIAAVIVEPVAGNMGLVLPEPGFLAGLREITARSGALLIFDEVMTGFRVALGGAQAHFGVTPDLTCLGKVLGGGLPAAAYGGRRDIMQRVAPSGDVYQAGTLSGNPLAMAAGLATLEEITRDGVFPAVAAATSHLAMQVQAEAQRVGIPFRASAIGSMWGFVLSDAAVTNYADMTAHANPTRYAQLFHALLAEGVYMAPSAFEAAFVSTAHTGECLTRTVTAFSNAFARMAGSGR